MTYRKQKQKCAGEGGGGEREQGDWGPKKIYNFFKIFIEKSSKKPSLVEKKDDYFSSYFRNISQWNCTGTVDTAMKCTISLIVLFPTPPSPSIQYL